MEILDDNDRRSPVWTKIETYLKERLATLREQNDNPADPEKTAVTRGAIKEIKLLLSQTKELPKHKASGTDYGS